MSGYALPLVGNFYVYLIVFANTFFKYRPNIKYKNMSFCEFQFKYKYTYISVFKCKYVFEQNPELYIKFQCPAFGYVTLG